MKSHSARNLCYGFSRSLADGQHSDFKKWTDSLSSDYEVGNLLKPWVSREKGKAELRTTDHVL